MFKALSVPGFEGGTFCPHVTLTLYPAETVPMLPLPGKRLNKRGHKANTA